MQRVLASARACSAGALPLLNQVRREACLPGPGGELCCLPGADAQEELGVNPPFHLDTEEQRKARDPQQIEEALGRFAENVYLIDQFGEDDIDKFVPRSVTTSSLRAVRRSFLTIFQCWLMEFLLALIKGVRSTKRSSNSKPWQQSCRCGWSSFAICRLAIAWA